MQKKVKIVLLALLMLLVIFSILNDMPIGQKWRQGLSLGLYLKLVGLLSLSIAVLVAWGYRNRIQASQKYRRADEVISKAEETYERKKQACVQMDKDLQAKFEEKEKGLEAEIESVRREYQKRLKVLQEQNIELKESVGKLMRTIKQDRQERS